MVPSSKMLLKKHRFDDKKTVDTNTTSVLKVFRKLNSRVASACGSGSSLFNQMWTSLKHNTSRVTESNTSTENWRIFLGQPSYMVKILYQKPPLGEWIKFYLNTYVVMLMSHKISRTSNNCIHILLALENYIYIFAVLSAAKSPPTDEWCVVFGRVARKFQHCEMKINMNCELFAVAGG